MELIDLLIEAEAEDLDWCTDPSDLERALARRLSALRYDIPVPVSEKGKESKLAKELGRVTQH